MNELQSETYLTSSACLCVFSNTQSSFLQLSSNFPQLHSFLFQLSVLYKVCLFTLTCPAIRTTLSISNYSDHAGKKNNYALSEVRHTFLIRCLWCFIKQASEWKKDLLWSIFFNFEWLVYFLQKIIHILALLKSTWLQFPMKRKYFELFMSRSL